ncbi:hypothetical protein D3C71_1636110 [compost metagenome]
MFADDLPLCCDGDTIGIDAKAHWSIGEGRRDAVAIAFQMDEAGRGDPLRILDKAVERAGNRHQCQSFLRPDVGDRATHLSMRSLCPEFLASKLQPVVQGIQRWKARNRLEEAVTRILHILLDLSFLPA